MANSNVNIGNKLFAYIAHGVDINENIKSNYNSSLIFIGDEERIYVPAMETYVGIGQTAYTNTISYLLNVDARITKLAGALQSSLVSKIYPNYNPTDIETILADESRPDVVKSTSVSYLTQEITIRGIGDYDPSTGLAYTKYTIADSYPSDKDSDGNVLTHNANTEGRKFATSGITVSYVSVPGVRQSDGSIASGQNYLVIDDKLTWSYMAAAYTYAMNFAREYTASEAERVYHNILGDYGGTLYTPVDFENVIISYQASDNSIKYKLSDDVANLYLHTSDANSAESSVSNYTVLTGEQVTKLQDYVKSLNEGTALAGGANFGSLSYYDKDVNVDTLYAASTTYNSTYNINLRDGIQTLKEVAYLLDVLTDGLDTPTYISYAQYQTAVGDTTGTFSVVTSSTSTSGTIDGGTYTLYTIPLKEGGNENNYAYYVTRDEDNLGIKMAYTLSSLQMQTSEVHNHAKLNELGQTSLRSIVATGSKFANVVVESSQSNPTKTDLNAKVDAVATGEQVDISDKGISALYDSHYTSTSSGWTGNTYVLGDANIKLNLTLAQTYIISNNTANGKLWNTQYYVDTTSITGANDYDMVGDIFVAADMTSLTPTGATYYTITTDSDGNFVSATVLDADKVITDTHNQEGVQYYVKYTDKYSPLANVSFKAIASATQLANIKSSNPTLRIYVGSKDASGKINITSASVVTDITTFTAESLYYNTLEYSGKTADQIETSVQPVIDNDPTAQDAIATVSWTTAYITNAISGQGDQLDEILAEAEQYTDDKIDALDSEYLYQDFKTNVWSNLTSGTNKYSTLVAGTTDYSNAYMAEYLYYRGLGEEIKINGETYTISATTDTVISLDGGKTTITIGADGSQRANSDSSYNVSRNPSEYIKNVIEENGVVTAVAAELPAAYISVHAETWGENGSSIYQRKYANFTTDTTNDINAKLAVATVDTATQQLLGFVSAKTYDNNLYVNATAKTGEKEYRLILNNDIKNNGIAVLDDAAFDAAKGGEGAGYFYMKADGTFAEVTSEDAKKEDWYIATAKSPWELAKILGTDGGRFVQLYQQVDKYAEIDLSTITWTDTATFKTFTCKAEGVEYTISNIGTDLYCVDGEIDNEGKTDDPRETVADNQYIKAQYRHISYAENGQGENQFDITANITHIEDATRKNTGFADAYDVRSFFENMFTWVNISASVDTDNLTKNAAWYSHITAEYVLKHMDSTGKVDIDIYTESGGVYTKIATPAIYEYKWDDASSEWLKDKSTAISDPATVSSGNRIAFEMTNTADGVEPTYYTTSQGVYTNPVNLTVTEYTNAIVAKDPNGNAILWN